MVKKMKYSTFIIKTKDQKVKKKKPSKNDDLICHTDSFIYQTFIRFLLKSISNIGTQNIEME